MSLKNWLHPPSQLRTAWLLVLPIMFSQVLQRLYPVVDSRYIGFLGDDALLIHSIQYNFIIFGQFIGVATAMSCFVFWGRPECIDRQGSVFKRYLALVSLFMIGAALLFMGQINTLMHQYKINPQDYSVAKMYFFIGLINMILQAVHGSLDGMLIASGQQKKALYISFALLIFNIISDVSIITFGFSGGHNSEAIYQPMILIAVTTTIAMLVACILEGLFISRKVLWLGEVMYRDLISVWSSEIGTYLIRGLTPFIYAWQLSSVIASDGFFTTYQLALQLSYFFCIPLIAGLQLAIMSATKASAASDNQSKVTGWWSNLLYTGLLPTSLLLVIGIIFPAAMMAEIFKYNIPQDHIAFVILFFAACLVGQFANVASVPIRARKKNYLVTRNFFLSEFIVMLGGTQALIYCGFATPTNAGLISLAFVATQLLLNLFCVAKLSSR